MIDYARTTRNALGVMLRDLKAKNKRLRKAARVSRAIIENSINRRIYEAPPGMSLIPDGTVDELVGALRELLTFSEFLEVSTAPEALPNYISAKNNAAYILAKLEQTS